MAPYLEYKDVYFQFVKSKSRTKELESSLKKTDQALTISGATVQSYQVENAALSRRIRDIESAQDHSAIAIKKRAMVLADQMFEFIKAWDGIRESPEFIYANSIEERNRMMIEWNKRSDANNAKYTTEFARKFSGRARAIYDEFLGLGLAADELGSMSSVIVNHSQTQWIATEIKHLAEKIQDNSTIITK